MRVLMLRSIVEGSRALDADKLYDLPEQYAKRLIREGHCEPLPKAGARGEGRGARTDN